MIENPLPQAERFNDRMKGLIPESQIIERDLAGASHRIIVQGRNWDFLVEPKKHVRKLESENSNFLGMIREMIDRLVKTNLSSHVVFGHLGERQVTSLAEESLYWDIQMPQGQPQLDPGAAQALIQTYEFLHYLPKEAHRFFPIFLSGYTKGHAVRVGTYAALLAQKLKDNQLSPASAAKAGLLHDMGKMQPVINQLVRSAEVLSENEYEKVKLHPVLGAMAWNELVKSGNAPVVDKKGVLEIHDGILEHHARPDEKGYPPFIKGHQLSLVGKIIAIADSFDAMTSHRKYRKHLKLTLEYAREELRRCSGMPWDHTKTKGAESERQFDPELVKLFLELNPTPIFHNEKW